MKMEYKKEPKNFEVLHELYLSIGYYRGKAIVKDENGSFYFVNCEENELPIGTLAESDLLKPLNQLEETEQKEILKIYAN